jgi:hypothetical protein
MGMQSERARHVASSAMALHPRLVVATQLSLQYCAIAWQSRAHDSTHVLADPQSTCAQHSFWTQVEWQRYTQPSVPAGAHCTSQ